MPDPLTIDTVWDEAYQHCTVEPEPCRRKCERDDAEACFSLAVEAQQRAQAAESQALFERACVLGHAVACTNYGAGLRARDVADEQACATRIFERTCSAGELRWGCGMLGAALALGEGTARDAARAHAILVRACDATEFFACRVLGTGYRNGWFGEPSPDEAVRAFQRACEGGLDDACHDADAL